MKMTVKKMMVLVTLAVSMTATAVTPLKRLPWLQAGDTIAILSPGGSVGGRIWLIKNEVLRRGGPKLCNSAVYQLI